MGRYRLGFGCAEHSARPATFGRPVDPWVCPVCGSGSIKGGLAVRRIRWFSIDAWERRPSLEETDGTDS